MPHAGVPVHVVEDDAGTRDALLRLFAGADIVARGHANAETLLAGEPGTHPLCVLADLRLPGMGGISLLRHLLAERAGSCVVMMAGHGDVPAAVGALKAGAVDCVEKPVDAGSVLGSVCEAAARVAEYHRLRADEAEQAGRLLTLTPREREIFEMLLEGHPNKVVASRLGISVRTAEHHRARIMDKTGARTLSALFRFVPASAGAAGQAIRRAIGTRTDRLRRAATFIS